MPFITPSGGSFGGGRRRRDDGDSTAAAILAGAPVALAALQFLSDARQNKELLQLRRKESEASLTSARDARLAAVKQDVTTVRDRRIRVAQRDFEKRLSDFEQTLVKDARRQALHVKSKFGRIQTKALKDFSRNGRESTLTTAYNTIFEMAKSELGTITNPIERAAFQQEISRLLSPTGELGSRITSEQGRFSLATLLQSEEMFALTETLPVEDIIRQTRNALTGRFGDLADRFRDLTQEAVTAAENLPNSTPESVKNAGLRAVQENFPDFSGISLGDALSEQSGQIVEPPESPSPGGVSTGSVQGQGGVIPGPAPGRETRQTMRERFDNLAMLAIGQERPLDALVYSGLSAGTGLIGDIARFFTPSGDVPTKPRSPSTQVGSQDGLSTPEKTESPTPPIQKLDPQAVGNSDKPPSRELPFDMIGGLIRPLKEPTGPQPVIRGPVQVPGNPLADPASLNVPNPNRNPLFDLFAQVKALDRRGPFPSLNIGRGPAVPPPPPGRGVAQRVLDLKPPPRTPVSPPIKVSVDDFFDSRGGLVAPQRDKSGQLMFPPTTPVSRVLGFNEQRNLLSLLALAQNLK